MKLKNSKMRFVLTSILSVFLLGGLAACNGDAEDNLDDVGDNIDEAAQDVGRSAEDAVD